MTKVKIILFAFVLLLLNACSDDFLQINDLNNPTASTYYTSMSNAQDAVTGVYAGFNSGLSLYFGEIYYILMYSTGEALYIHPESRYTDFNNYNYSSTNTLIAAYYEEWYNIVRRANDVIYGLRTMEQSGNYKDDDITKLRYMLGQCYFLRGVAYSNLVRSFGQRMPSNPDYSPDLPGVILSDTVVVRREQMYKERSSCGEVYNYVIKDFQRAESLLPISWPSEDAGRATKGSAQAYLGETYVYLQKWDSARIAFDKILANPQYSLMQNFKHNFDYKYINNSESLFEVGFNNMVVGYGYGTHIYRSLALQSWGTSQVRSETVDKFSSSVVINDQTLAAALAAKNLVYGSTQKGYVDELINVSQAFKGHSFDGKEAFLNAIASLTSIPFYKTDGTTYQPGVKAFLNAVSPKDPRLAVTVFTPKVDSIVVFVPETKKWKKILFDYSVYGIRKYISDSVNVDVAQAAGMGNDGYMSQNFRIMRLDDVYLYYAEVMHHLNRDDIAVEYINKIVRRANGLPVNSTSPVDVSPTDVMKEIINQTFLEMCMEGKIWFHYRRWNIAKQEWSKYGYKENKNECLPIPQTEFDSNPGIKTQNEGY
ncbi:MAG: RagB/SusD family nutrient uptake outer membrane protein [Paludibacter sp.]|nr:RagB/SusD family nutrient uptake outer membrane protein [Paludibacter sp.]